MKFGISMKMPAKNHLYSGMTILEWSNFTEVLGNYSEANNFSVKRRQNYIMLYSDTFQMKTLLVLSGALTHCIENLNYFPLEFIKGSSRQYFSGLKCK
jgi:hypothetical protein